MTTPYTYIQCPCSDASTLGGGRPDVSSPTQGGPDDDEDNAAFDPHAPRSNYSLYPIEYLLYCEDCHQIRCPRCVAEEVVTYYCPHCLFEVPSSNIKSEGNRCNRNCFSCPICIGPLSATSIEQAADSSTHLSAENARPASSLGGGGPPYVLTCAYCNWSSSEIGIELEKPNGLYNQLSRLRNGGRPRLTPKERKEQRRKDSTAAAPAGASGSSHTTTTQTARGAADHPSSPSAPALADDELDIETQFANLKSFYQTQLSDTAGAGMAGLSSLGDLGFNSPGSLSRIMSLYTGGGGLADKRHKARIGTMREALDAEEGLKVLRQQHSSPSSSQAPTSDTTSHHHHHPTDGLDERAAITNLHHSGWDGTSTASMRTSQAPYVGSPHPHGTVRFPSSLRPIPFLFRTKRSKRCPVCRHIITKPESKVASVRFRISLVAKNYMPTITARPLVVTTNNGNPNATSNPIVPPRDSPLVGTTDVLLRPLEPAQYLVTFRNPIFEPVRVSIATPAATPGRFASTVTVLCPQFEIGANTDMWDDPLRDGSSSTAATGAGAASSGVASGPSATTTSGGSSSDAMRRKALLRGSGAGSGDGSADSGSVVEAGKIWERGRNWVTVVVEVVPPSLRLDLLGIGLPSDQVDRSPLRPDEDLVEIPMFVRVEWDAEPAGDEVGHAPGAKDKDAREKRELAYWVVVGAGRIMQF